MYSDMSGHVGAIHRPLTQSIHMYSDMKKNSTQTVPRPLGDLSKMYLLDALGAEPLKLYIGLVVLGAVFYYYCQ